MVFVQCPPPWELYVDGAANQRGSGVGLVLVSPKRITIEKSLRLNFSATNNEAEYEALLIGMIMVQRMGGKAVRVFSYSKLVVGQVRSDLEAIQACKSTYAKSGAYKRNLRFLTCLMFLKVEIHMQICWPP